MCVYVFVAHIAWLICERHVWHGAPKFELAKV